MGTGMRRAATLSASYHPAPKMRWTIAVNPRLHHDSGMSWVLVFVSLLGPPLEGPRPHPSWNEPSVATEGESIHANTAPPPPPPPPRLAVPTEARPSEGLETRANAGRGIAVTGFVLDGLGVVGLALIALPFFISAEIAKDRAQSDPVLVSVSELERRAARRMSIATTSTWASLGVLGGGLVLTSVGLAVWLPARRALRRHAPAPRVSLAPAGLTLRF